MTVTDRVKVTLLACLALSAAWIHVARGGMVEEGVARLAATENAQVYFPGRWQICTNFVYYDLEGKPSAYAFVFEKDFGRNSASTGLVAGIAAGYKRLAELREAYLSESQEEGGSGKRRRERLEAVSAEITAVQREMNGLDRFATVITGADDSRPTMRKCHEGLPTAFVRRQEAEETLRQIGPTGTGYRIGRHMFLGPFDESYEVVADGSPALSARDGRPAMVLDLRTRTLESGGNLRKKQAEIRGKTDERFAQEYKRAWDRYRQKHRESRGRQEGTN